MSTEHLDQVRLSKTQKVQTWQDDGWKTYTRVCYLDVRQRDRQLAYDALRAQRGFLHDFGLNLWACDEKAPVGLVSQAPLGDGGLRPAYVEHHCLQFASGPRTSGRTQARAPS